MKEVAGFLALVPALACAPVATTFTCTSDIDCASAGPPSRCEASKVCSVGDDACPGAWRYVRPGGGSVSGSCISYADAVLGDLPVAYWRFNEAGGLIAHDATAHGHDGTVDGGLQFGSTALRAADDSAAHFDGLDAFVSVPDDPALGLADAFTMETWLNVDHFDGTDNPRILHKGGYVGDGYALWLRDTPADAGPAEVQFLSTTPGAFTGTHTIASSSNHYFAVTWDGGVLQMYIDGTPTDSTSMTGPVGASVAPLDLGRSEVSGGTHYWLGSLQDLALYDRALAPQDVARHQAVGLDPGSGAQTLDVGVGCGAAPSLQWSQLASAAIALAVLRRFGRRRRR